MYLSFDGYETGVSSSGHDYSNIAVLSLLVVCVPGKMSSGSLVWPSLPVVAKTVLTVGVFLSCHQSEISSILAFAQR